MTFFGLFFTWFFQKKLWCHCVLDGPKRPQNFVRGGCVDWFDFRSGFKIAFIAGDLQSFFVQHWIIFFFSRFQFSSEWKFIRFSVISEKRVCKYVWKPLSPCNWGEMGFKVRCCFYIVFLQFFAYNSKTKTLLHRWCLVFRNPCQKLNQLKKNKSVYNIIKVGSSDRTEPGNSHRILQD